MGFLQKLEVPHAPGLTYKQLFLSVSSKLVYDACGCRRCSRSAAQNDDLTPVPEKEWTWRARNFTALYVFLHLLSFKSPLSFSFRSWIADSFNVNTYVFLQCQPPRILNSCYTQMDDCFVNDSTWSVMVAGMDLCMGGLWGRRSFHRNERPPRSHLPRYVSGSRKNKFRSLRESVVHFQPRRDGMYLVRCSGEHRRRLC